MKPNRNTTRKIIEIDEDLCTGCGECIPGCAEGALRIIDGKARLIGDLFCDGLGACIGHCPVGAMEVIEREAEPYDERKVMETIAKQGRATIEAHLRHLREHGATDYHREGVAYLREQGIPLPPAEERAASKSGLDRLESGCAGASRIGGGCPGSAPLRLEDIAACPGAPTEELERKGPASRLGNWPVQISLVPIHAPYFNGAHLLVAADCTAFATSEFHERLAKDRVVIIGCPKLDDAGGYADKLGAILATNDVRSVTVAHMTVPCCFGMISVVKSAIAASGKDVPLKEAVIGMDGRIEWLPALLQQRAGI